MLYATAQIVHDLTYFKKKSKKKNLEILHSKFFNILSIQNY